jgi:hypothetical protein
MTYGRLPDGRLADAETMGELFVEGASVRQGDVLLRRIAAKPRGCAPVERDRGAVVLAYGEVTGHAHQLRGSQVTQYRDTTGGYLTIREIAEPLVHEEHGAIANPPAEYEIGQQVEYEPQALRNVAD